LGAIDETRRNGAVTTRPTLCAAKPLCAAKCDAPDRGLVGGAGGE